MFRLNLFSYFSLLGNMVLNSVIHTFSFLGNPVEIRDSFVLRIFAGEVDQNGLENHRV